MFRTMSRRRETFELAGRRLEAIASGPEHDDALASLALWPWVELMRRYGMKIERFASVMGVEVATLRDPGARVSQANANRMAELVFQRVGSHAAMEAASSIEAGQFTLFELIARTAPTVGDALVLAARFSPLIHADVEATHEALSDGSCVVRLVAPPGYSLHHGYYELSFGISMVAIRRDTERPDIAPSEVWFRHCAPTDRAAFERVLGPSVQFGMPEYRMSFSREIAALPHVRKNSAAHAVAVHAADDFVKQGERVAK